MTTEGYAPVHAPSAVLHIVQMTDPDGNVVATWTVEGLTLIQRYSAEWKEAHGVRRNAPGYTAQVLRTIPTPLMPRRCDGECRTLIADRLGYTIDNAVRPASQEAQDYADYCLRRLEGGI